MKTESFIKDSQNLIQKCQQITFDKKPYLYSMVSNVIKF
jgi:hypothetical protein